MALELERIPCLMVSLELKRLIPGTKYAHGSLANHLDKWRNDMKTAQILLAGAALIALGNVYAADSSERIPAPVVQLRAAGTLPNSNEAVVKSSPIPAPTVQVVPVASAESQGYSADSQQSDYLQSR